jgi:hypothetical protein
MALQAECPRCATTPDERDGVWVCPMHGATAPLWRAVPADYGALLEHRHTADGLPSWLPWPLPASWAVTGFGVVRAPGAAARATFVSCAGIMETDGAVSLSVVTEEPGTGLGARVAGLVHDDPGAQTQGRPVQTRVRARGVQVPLWLLSTTADGAAGEEREEPWDRAVLVGETQARWLWLVTTPASAALGLPAWVTLEDLGGRGPELVELPFAERPADW